MHWSWDSDKFDDVPALRKLDKSSFLANFLLVNCAHDSVLARMTGILQQRGRDSICADEALGVTLSWFLEPDFFSLAPPSAGVGWGCAFVCARAWPGLNE